MKYDVDYITQYILNYDPGVSKTALTGGVALVCGTTVGLSLIKPEKPALVKNISIVLTGLYVVLMFYVTVLCRDSSHERLLIWKPFWSYFRLYNRILAEHIMNVLMFMPFGFLVCSILERSSVWKVCLAGSVVSLAIEVTQFITKKGICNIDDVINNTIGCAIGCAGFVVCYKMARHIA